MTRPEARFSCGRDPRTITAGVAMVSPGGPYIGNERRRRLVSGAVSTWRNPTAPVPLEPPSRGRVSPRYNVCAAASLRGVRSEVSERRRYGNTIVGTRSAGPGQVRPPDGHVWGDRRPARRPHQQHTGRVLLRLSGTALGPCRRADSGCSVPQGSTGTSESSVGVDLSFPCDARAASPTSILCARYCA